MTVGLSNFAFAPHTAVLDVIKTELSSIALLDIGDDGAADGEKKSQNVLPWVACLPPPEMHRLKNFARLRG